MASESSTSERSITQRHTKISVQSSSSSPTNTTAPSSSGSSVSTLTSSGSPSSQISPRSSTNQMTLQLGRLDENEEVVCSGLTPRTAAVILDLQNEVKIMKTKVKELESQVEEQNEINRLVHNLRSQFSTFQLNKDRAEIDMLNQGCMS